MPLKSCSSKRKKTNLSLSCTCSAFGKACSSHSTVTSLLHLCSASNLCDCVWFVCVWMCVFFLFYFPPCRCFTLPACLLSLILNSDVHTTQTPLHSCIQSQACDLFICVCFLELTSMCCSSSPSTKRLHECEITHSLCWAWSSTKGGLKIS